MSRKNDDGSIGGVKGSDRVTKSTGIESTETVDKIKNVGATAGIGAVKGAGSIDRRKPTRTMTYAERQELFRMIDEEATSMLKNGVLSPQKKALVEQAVKMAVDAALVDEEDEGGSDAGKK